MAIFRCKMCGGELTIDEGNSVCTCEYCGTRQTVPKADNEKKMTLFNRASRLLRNCEFDKASGVFETIVADFPEEAEAYWGLVLCKYGIEYVDDPGTGRKVPTCHRSSFDSVLDDANFEQACEYGDATARRVYRDEARKIEEIRKGIIEVSGREDPYDVFISYKETDDSGDRTLDSVIAQDIYKELNREGYRTFFSRITLEKKLGTEYEPYIFAALNSAKVMLVVGTDYENFDSVWVKNEWSRFLKLIASGQKKTLIPVFKNMDAYDMPKEFARLSAQDMGKVGAMQDLLRGIEKLIPKKKDIQAAGVVGRENVVVQGEGDMKTAAALKRGELALEGREWDKARQFFDQALMLDAESAAAYFGSALAELKATSPEDYIRTTTGCTPRTEKLSLAPDTAYIQYKAEEYAVPGYLTEEDIKKFYERELKYPSTVKGQQELQTGIIQVVENNRSLSLALRFAKGAKKEEIERFKKNLYEKLEENVQEAKQQEANALVALKEDYARFLRVTDQKVGEANREAETERRRAYDQICAAQLSAKTVRELRTTMEQFGKLADYLDCRSRVAQCEAAIKELQVKETAKNKKTAILLASIVAAVIALIIIVTKVIVPNSNYNKAVMLSKEGKYDEAIMAFEALNGYKDSEEQIFAVHNLKTVETYEKAKSLFESGRYEDAYKLFYSICEYKDSQERIEKLEPYVSVSIGDTICFGAYEQDNNLANGKEEIDWIVLAKENGRLFVISKKALDFQQYSTKRTDATWENSSLRIWLNSTFLKEAFTDEENAKIPMVTVTADMNPYYSTNPGNATEDQVFLLSINEADWLFLDDSARQCEPTVFVKKSGFPVNPDKGTCTWWLRSPARNSSCVGYVDTYGSVSPMGDYVDDNKAVRPALWIDLTS